MSADVKPPSPARRRLRWLLLLALSWVVYLLLREYADRARSLEAVLGLYHGNPYGHMFVAIATLGARLLAYGSIGGVLLAWPLQELLQKRAAAATGPAPANTAS